MSIPKAEVAFTNRRQGNDGTAVQPEQNDDIRFALAALVATSDRLPAPPAHSKMLTGTRAGLRGDPLPVLGTRPSECTPSLTLLRHQPSQVLRYDPCPAQFPATVSGLQPDT